MKKIIILGAIIIVAVISGILIINGITSDNDDEKHLQEIAKIAERLSNVQAIHVEPYNPLAKSKYRQLNRADGGIPEDFPADETIRNYLKTITSYTSKSVELP